MASQMSKKGMGMERNSMSIGDIRGDTLYATEAVQKVSPRRGEPKVSVAIVIALKRCGCNGPEIGQVQSVPLEEWPTSDEIPVQPEGSKAKLWSAWPPGRNRPVAYAWGVDAAAKALRNWHAVRNVAKVMKKREAATVESVAAELQEKRRAKAAEVTKATPPPNPLHGFCPECGARHGQPCKPDCPTRTEATP